MALGLSLRGINISRARLVVKYIKFLNQYTRIMSSALIITIIGFIVVAVRVFTETMREDD
jgi:hypothetical protein